VEDRYRQLLVICGAIAASLVMVNVVLAILLASGSVPSQDPPPALPLVMFGIGLVLLVTAPSIKRAIFKRAEAEGVEGGARAAAWTSATIVASALREAAGLLGFVLAFLTGNPWWSWGLGGAALLAMYVDRPRREMFG
jgi:F0F1-type ATP synthase membrane subunit c/vacuolar-type H+-ATPase subunit K